MKGATEQIAGLKTGRVRTRRRLPSLLAYALDASHAVAREPVEGIERVRERLAERRDLAHGRYEYPARDDWERRLHDLLGAPWPCAAQETFGDIWREMLAELESKGLRHGRGAFGGWDDADPAFARAVWCSAVHLRPQAVIETGVARGFSTRLILEALDRADGAGALWSVDLPPLREPDLAVEVAAAVPEHLRARWHLVRGSSRRQLPGLVRELSQIDLFVHDSMHTTRNVRFELSTVWASLRAGGLVVADDVHRNSGLAASGDLADAGFLVGQHAEDDDLFAIIAKSPLDNLQPPHML